MSLKDKRYDLTISMSLKEDGSDKPLIWELDNTYHDMPYGAVASVQKVAVSTLGGALADMGIEAAKAEGLKVPLDVVSNKG